MDMILVDWTRMGRAYCLAGVVAEQGQYRVVRPLLAKCQDAPVRNVGWSAYLLDGHSRWEVLELIGAEPAASEAPHLEDLWVRAIRSRRRLAPPAQRREILTATAPKRDEPLFGEPFAATRTAAYLRPGCGRQSLATLILRSDCIGFNASQREGTAEPDVRVTLPIPGLGERTLAVKDHHLLARAEFAATDLEGQIRRLNLLLAQMGAQVAVRLGLSRPFQARSDSQGFCWLMADGFFFMTDPQP